jgi:hypothetical protein
MTDDYRDNMLRMVKELEAQGVNRYTSAPPIYRLAWRLGFRVKPPLYQSFGVRTVIFGLSFVIVFVVGQWLLALSARDFMLKRALLVGIFSAALSSLATSFILWRKLERLRLPQLDS